MTVRKLIAELQKMPQDATVVMWVKPGITARELHSVEKRYEDMIFLNDIYYTPYMEGMRNENPILWQEREYLPTRVTFKFYRSEVDTSYASYFHIPSSRSRSISTSDNRVQ